jgi:hypothetical protein
MQSDDVENYKKCAEMEKDLKDCYEALYMYYFNSKKEEVMKVNKDNI